MGNNTTRIGWSVGIIIALVIFSILSVGVVVAQQESPTETPTAETGTENETETTETPAGAVTDQGAETETETDTQTTEGQVRLRLLHAAPDAPAVDVFVNDELVVENLTYENSSDYVTVEAGNTAIRVTTADDETATVLANTVALSPGSYTAFVFQAPGNTTQNLTTMPSAATESNTSGENSTAADNNAATETATETGMGPTETAVPTTGTEPSPAAENSTATETPTTTETELTETAAQTTELAVQQTSAARASTQPDPEGSPLRLGLATEDGTSPEGDGLVRIGHLSPNTQAVDVVVTGVDIPLVENVTYGSTSDYVNLPDSTYTLEVQRAAPGESSPVTSTLDLTVNADTAQTVYLIGYRSSEAAVTTDRNVSLRAIVLNDTLGSDMSEAEMTEPETETTTDPPAEEDTGGEAAETATGGTPAEETPTPTPTQG